MFFLNKERPFSVCNWNNLSNGETLNKIMIIITVSQALFFDDDNIKNIYSLYH